MHKQSTAHQCLSLTASLLLWVTLPLAAQSGPTTVRRDLHHDVSPPLSELIKNAPPPSLEIHEAEPMRMIPLPPGLTQLEEDPVRQRTFAPLTPVVSQSFEGLGNGQYGFSVTSAPPDTNGTVGASQYVQWVNTSFAIFNKSTGALMAGPTAGNTMWSGFGGGCQTNNDGDPIVLYDKIAGRWIFSQFSVSTTPYLQCIAVSTTSDATGTYNRYSFQYSNFDDYPKMAVWSDGYYETFNMFNGNTFVGADACAYNRTAMMAGQTATQVCFQQGSSVGGLLPSDLDGTTAPPAGSPNYLMYYGTNTLNLYKFHVDFTTPANSTFTGPTVISVAAFSPLCGGATCVPQPGTTNKLDSLADRLMNRLAYRNFGTHESLVVNHSVTAGSGGGIRWYEVQNPSGTPILAQQGTFAPDSNYRWMGSIAMDKASDIAVGYSTSSSTVFPSIAFAGRIPSDPSGTLESETSVVSGAGSQTGTLTRWGDYSAMQVDPADDCTFWYTQEYIKTNGSFNWNTRIANFQFPGCSTTTPDYTIGASPSSLTITQGANGTSTITITSLNGFNSATTLSASGLPSGVTASFSANPITPPANGSATSTLTLSASSTASTGTVTVTVTGTSGSLTHSTTIALTVNAATVPNFTIGASPASLTVPQSGSGTSTVTITSQNSFNSATTLSASGLPSGVTASFSANPVTPPANGSATSILTLTASATATTGNATVTVTGTSGTLSHSTTIALTVTASGGGGAQTASYSSTLKAPQCATVGISCDSGPSLILGRDTMSGGAEPNQPNTINSSCADGTSGTFHSDESNDRIVVATTDGSNFAPGKTVTISATVWAWSTPSSDALDLYYAANASSPTWVFLKTIVPTVGGAQTLSTTYTLPSGSLQAVRANLRYQGSAASCAAGSYTDHDDLVFAVGAGTADFSIAASPATLSVAQGASGTSTITVASLNGFSAATTLSASGLPSGVTASFSANPVTPPSGSSATSVLTLTASTTATTGNATVTVTGTSGSLTHSTTISLTVTAANGAQTAVYSSTLKAPQCATVGTSCDSGASLLLGRDTMSGGAEPNQPNTINSSCADGTSGTFHSDESSDRLVVTSTNGGLLTHGNTVTVTATVWAWNTGSSDSLDLYYAANANSPTWVFIKTIVPTAGGAQALSTTFTLPTGSLQAVRANFRYQGSAAACNSGSYNDHDDLIFAVN